MNKDIIAKKFNFNDIEGISLNQLTQHYELYKGYVNKLNEVWNILDKEKEFKDSNSTYSKMRSLQLGQSYALNGVKLHELYFENLGGNKNKPSGKILRMIEDEFGSYNFFSERFKSVGSSVRGWVVLAIDSIDNKLHIFGSDAHDVGSIWMAYPILIMDVYEHAYMIDFGIDRKKYMDIFMKNINWNVVNNRLKYYNDSYNKSTPSYEKNWNQRNPYQ